MPLERLFAMHPGQRTFRRDWGNDLVFLLLNAVLIRLGLLAIVAATIFAAALIVPASLQTTIGDLPVWAQLPLVIVLSDLGFYWTHRMFHAVPWLWRFHAVHHSIEELDWLAAARVHPLDQIVTKGVALLPVVALGFSEWVIGIYALLYQWQSVFIHANLCIGFRPFRLLVASPEFHHWHHSNDREARDRNFAGQLSFLDALFGTLHMPRERLPQTYGLDRPMQQRYAMQMIYPFVSDSDDQYRPAVLPGLEKPALQTVAAHPPFASERPEPADVADAETVGVLSSRDAAAHR
ncbi:sterol desaturase family protein [Bradyrhizobium arachidis]|uniref:sterol desaturase family protein n=1 Tax=Bradyrhizobium arachidis TaxID=858423 RepID=UPI002163B9BF|nr:sterol desaturase family protein [Bradyrhizobium arachidis]